MNGIDVVSSRASAAPRRRLFYPAAAIAIVVTVVVGFAPTYYLKGYFRGRPLSPLHHLHGLVFTSWVVLFCAQVALVARGRVDLHRRLGAAGAVLAAFVVAVGFTIAIVTGRRSFAAGNAGAVPFLAIPFGDMIVFGALAGAGLWWRRRPDVHKRLMSLATISILAAAFARWPFAVFSKGPLGFFGATDLFVVAAAIADVVTLGRVHPATLWGGLLLVGSQVLRLELARTAVWQVFARSILGGFP